MLSKKITCIIASGVNVYFYVQDLRSADLLCKYILPTGMRRARLEMWKVVDPETLKQTEALALKLIRLADARHEVGDRETEAVVRSVVEALSDVLDLAWVRAQRQRLH